MAEMKIDLSKIGMEKGKQYESIVSTVSPENVKNAAPIGIICSGKDKIVCRIFKGGKTLDNILKTRKFTVNITHDPELFLLTTLGNLEDNCFNNDLSIKNIDAYFMCEVTGFKEAVKQSDPIKKKGEAVVIKSKVKELVIERDINALNRGFGYVVESLSNLTRFDMVNENQKQEYLNRFREAKRVVNKIGYKDEIKAINEIKKEYIKKGYEP